MTQWGYQPKSGKMENSVGQMIWFLQHINVKRRECGHRCRYWKYIYPFGLDSESNKPTIKKTLVRFSVLMIFTNCCQFFLCDGNIPAAGFVFRSPYFLDRRSTYGLNYNIWNYLYNDLEQGVRNISEPRLSDVETFKLNAKYIKICLFLYSL